ncbi:MAG TPA: MMPL family transporter [Candidatus Atribacteria bacterium]|nr:MMPL family transporter [Candidatus Atribacteria bacterium]
MKRFFSLICRRRAVVCVIFAAAVVLSLLLLPGVSVNYNLADYLPDHSDTKRAIKVLEQEFSYPGTVYVMLEDRMIPEILETKRALSGIDGVRSVLWLDDLYDITQPLSQIPEPALENWYKDGAALLQVEFEENDYSEKTTHAIKEIRALLGDEVAISGPAESSRYMKSTLAEEILRIMLIVVPLCLLILVLASSSWVEPFIYLGIIGVSIAINMGTNAFFKNVSFITHAISAVLQLAISMDYSIFLMHRYLEERKRGLDVISAVVNAAHQALSSIAASAATTIAGFLALLFMKYGIGADIGIVLAKGILLSFITVVVLMPVMIIYMSRIIEKTSHKVFTPNLERLARGVIKLRYLIIAVVFLVAIPSYLAQQSNHFIYGETTEGDTDSRTMQDTRRIEERFGTNNIVLLLVPSGDIAREIALSEEIEALEFVNSVHGLVTLADPSIPREFLPQSVVEAFATENYSRFIINLNVKGEAPETFAAIERLKETTQKHFPDKWLIGGNTPAVADIKSTVDSDIFMVNMFSIVAVALIIMLTFRSFSLPVILVSAIEASVWINMGIPYFTGSSLVFIGYLVVSSLQLGATIDYAILITNRYMEFRTTMSPADAAMSAVKTAGNSVIVSALILMTAGFAEGAVSSISSISEIGVLLGRGALLSGLIVLTLLPSLLILLDGVIHRTTLLKKNITKA